MKTTTQKTFTVSKQTLGILKNFSSLNSNILVKVGNVIKTITPSKNGMAEAILPEDFPQEFGIWDLNKFLGVISLFNSPVFTFGDKNVKISDANTDSVVHYFYSEPRLLTVPTKNVNMPKTDIVINLSDKLLSELQKASSVMQLPDLSFQNDNGKIYAVVCDISDPTTNSYKTIVADNYTGTSKFRLNFKMDNIRIVSGDYTVSFSKNIVGEFSNNTLSLKYWFAMETTSTYED
jgi:hypothetical protein